MRRPEQTNKPHADLISLSAKYCMMPVMKKTSNAAEEARQWAMTIRLLFVAGALAGLVACILVARLM
jgi:hypothetical protein